MGNLVVRHRHHCGKCRHGSFFVSDLSVGFDGAPTPVYGADGALSHREPLRHHRSVRSVMSCVWSHAA